MIRQEFRIQSFERIGTTNQDTDQGVIRVAGARLEELGGRNALVSVSIIENGRAGRSIVRIVRAATTGEHALSSDQVAMQYDDRIALGIAKAGATIELEIQKVNSWGGLPRFLLGHTSPLVRKEAVFGLALMVVGAVFGAIVGFATGSLI